MSSAVSGLKNHQLYMDVVANNIANVNTYGYKASRVNFKEMLSATVAVGTQPRAGSSQGGTNGVQLGMGVSIGGIDNMMGQGSMVFTGKNTDMAIQGEGFFVLQNFDTAFYTRDGSFGLDRDGYLTDRVSGAYVMGGDAAAPTKIRIDPAWGWSSFSFSPDGQVTGVKSDGTIDEVNSPQLLLAKFSNPEGLVRSGGNLFAPGPNSGTADGMLGTPATAGRGTVVAGSLEASNVDLAEQFSRMIMAERGFQANSRLITASDEMLQDLVNMKR